jgi:hypothetical protein
MKPDLEAEFRERVRAWAERPPRRTALDVASRARATAAAHGAHRRLVSAPLAWAAAGLAVALVSLALSRAAEPSGDAAPQRIHVVRAPPTAAAPAASRLVVVELRSGSRLYVDLAAGRRSS